MSAESGATRWWENYLVRYFMPSIAGAIIVNWLLGTDGALRTLLLLSDFSKAKDIDSTSLVLLFLYGNLFCYVASYPILGFHVTRVVSLSDQTSRFLANEYLITLLAAAVAIVCAVLPLDADHSMMAALGLVAAFALLQGLRMIEVTRPVKISGLSGPVQMIYAYYFSLAKRRGIGEELKKTSVASSSPHGSTSNMEVRSIWRKEFVESYRHMREHGNSAFIFLLELTLAAICSLVLAAFHSFGPKEQLAALGVLLGLWSVPAMFIHHLGQEIERRFSWYEKSVKP